MASIGIDLGDIRMFGRWLSDCDRRYIQFSDILTCPLIRSFPKRQGLIRRMFIAATSNQKAPARDNSDDDVSKGKDKEVISDVFLADAVGANVCVEIITTQIQQEVERFGRER